MNNKCAVMIIGEQNSGKTTTINYFDWKFDEFGKKKKVCQPGLRKMFLFQKVSSVGAMIYFIPSSPTERKTSLADSYPNYKPQLLLLAEQKGSAEYSNTVETLKKDGYDYKEFLLRDTDLKKEGNHWQKQANISETEFLDQRAEDIANIFRKFIKARICS